MKYKLFCDLDGVLADFEGGYLKLTGIDISNNFQTNSGFWKPIDKAGSKFWEYLEWMKDGKELWKFIQPFNPVILSAPSRQKSSHIGKQKWVKNNLKNVPLLLKRAEEKQQYASENHILIDDRSDNCERWTNAGGISIVHKNAKNTISQLYKIIYNG